MAGYGLRAFFARRRRAGLTALVAAMGVAVIAGTFVFTDTIHRSLQGLFAGTAQGSGLVVTGRHAIASDPSAGAPVPDALIGRIRGLPGVGAAAGQISGVITIVGRGGRALASRSLPAVGLSDLPAPFRGVRILQGAPPRGAGEVAIDARTARQQHLTVGDTVRILTGQPARPFRISAIARLGPPAPAGERFAVFGLATARLLFNEPATVDQIDVAVDRSLGTPAVARAVAGLLPAGLTVGSRGGAADQAVARVSATLEPLSRGLIAFALVAIVVGALLIFNTFSITATQRAGELALLRALGATRGQILRVVLLEALLVGLAGSVIGLALGPLAALAIRALFDTTGLALPAGGLVVSGRTVLVGAATGLGASLLAAVVPAVRAGRTPPLEALRRVSLPAQPQRLGWWRALGCAALVAAGLAVIFTASGDDAQRLRAAAIGSGIVCVAVLLITPAFVRRLSRVVLWPMRRRHGAVAELAREQALQRPGRAALSASSLTVGLALVLLVTVYAGGLRAAVNNSVRQTIVGDVAIESADGTSSIPAASVRAAASVPGLVGLSSLSTAEADLGRAGPVQVNAVDPTSWPQVYRFQWVSGSNAAFQGLGIGDVVVEQDTARAAHLSVGDHAMLDTGSGRRVPVTVRGIYRDPGLLRGIVMPSDWFAALFHQPRLQDVFVKLGPGTSRVAALAALRAGLQQLPGVVARPQAQLAAQVENRVFSVLGLFYALLALSLIMSLIGIAGTLTLSVHESTQELGLLRALGMSAAQGRALIRDLSVLTAAVGTITGAVLGLVLGWALTRAMSPEGLVFAFPWAALAAAVAIGLLAAVLAAVPPARRVTRIDVLSAIAYE